MDGLSGVFSAITNFAPGIIPGVGPQGAVAGPVTPTAALTGVGQLVTALGGLASSLSQSGLGQGQLGTSLPTAGTANLADGDMGAAATAFASPLTAAPVDPNAALATAAQPGLAAAPQFAAAMDPMAGMAPAGGPMAGPALAGASMCGCAGPMATAASPMMAMPGGAYAMAPGGGAGVPNDFGLQDTLGDADALATGLQAQTVPGGGGDLADADGAGAGGLLEGLTDDKLGSLGAGGVDFFSNLLEGITGSASEGDSASYEEVMASGDDIVGEYGGSGGASEADAAAESGESGATEEVSDADGASSSTGGGSTDLTADVGDAFAAYGELEADDEKTFAKDETIAAFWETLQEAESSEQATAIGEAFEELSSSEQEEFSTFITKLYTAFDDGKVPAEITSAIGGSSDEE